MWKYWNSLISWKLTAISLHADMDIPVPSICFNAYSRPSGLQNTNNIHHYVICPTTIYFRFQYFNTKFHNLSVLQWVYLFIGSKSTNYMHCSISFCFDIRQQSTYSKHFIALPAKLHIHVLLQIEYHINVLLLIEQSTEKVF